MGWGMVSLDTWLWFAPVGCWLAGVYALLLAGFVAVRLGRRRRRGLPLDVHLGLWLGAFLCAVIIAVEADGIGRPPYPELVLPDRGVVLLEGGALRLRPVGARQAEGGCVRVAFSLKNLTGRDASWSPARADTVVYSSGEGALARWLPCDSPWDMGAIQLHPREQRVLWFLYGPQGRPRALATKHVTLFWGKDTTEVKTLAVASAPGWIRAPARNLTDGAYHIYHRASRLSWDVRVVARQAQIQGGRTTLTLEFSNLNLIESAHVPPVTAANTYIIDSRGRRLELAVDSASGLRHGRRLRPGEDYLAELSFPRLAADATPFYLEYGGQCRIRNIELYAAGKGRR